MTLISHQRVGIKEYDPRKLSTKKSFLELVPLAVHLLPYKQICTARSEGGSVYAAMVVQLLDSRSQVERFFTGTRYSQIKSSDLSDFLNKSYIITYTCSGYTRQLPHKNIQIVMFGEEWGSSPGYAWMVYGLISGKESKNIVVSSPPSFLEDLILL